MPELPEVETTARGIAPHVVGKRLQQCLVREPRLRWPVPQTLAAEVEGKKLLSVGRRGKYLLLGFKHGTALWHLGMSGSLRIVAPAQPPGKHDHVDWVFSRDVALRFNDPRRFGALLWTSDPFEEHPLINHLGPEPLSDDYTGDYLYQRSRKRTTAVKQWLMDSRIVVGVGNIYANETLFACGIHPLKAAGKLSRPQCEKLVNESRRILQYAINRGGTTLRDFVGGDGKPGYFAQELTVYGRAGQPCNHCGKPLTSRPIGGRQTVYCTACQK